MVSWYLDIFYFIYCNGFVILFSSVLLLDVLRDHRIKYLPSDDEHRERFTVRRYHILQDTLHMFRRAKLSLTKHLKVTFVGEPAVDAGGPLREFFHYILLEIAENNSLSCGSDTARCPLHNLVELERKTY